VAVVVAVAVAPISAAAECRTAVSLGVEWDPVGFHGVEWLRARVMAAAIGIAAAIGTVAATGTAEAIGAVATIGTATITGTAVTGIIIGEIITADGVGGTVTGGVIPGTTSCSLAVLASHGGGAGAGVPGQAGAGAMVIRTATDTVTMATAILTTVAAIPITAMATAMAMDMDTATDTVLKCSTESTVAAANPELPSCNDVSRARVTTMDPLTEFWDRKRVGQFGITSRSTAT